MNRLLFAAGRGARIQVRVFEFDKWVNTPGMRFEYPDVYRIHPDDEDLQYGPISAALRAWASFQLAPNGFAQAARAIAADYEPHWSCEYESELHRSLFILILAESMADLGL